MKTFVIALGVLTVCSVALAEVVTFQEGLNGSTQEIWFSGNPGGNPTHNPQVNASRGWSDPLSSGGMGASSRAHVTVIKFDDILNQIPADQEIVSATLRVTQGNDGGANATGVYNVHRVLVDWSESPLSAGNFDGAGTDLIGPDAFNPGTEITTTFQVSTDPGGRTVPGSSYAFTDVTDDVRGFYEGDFSNYGWAFVKPSGQSPGWTLLGQNGGAGVAGFSDFELPLLEIQFQAIPLTPEPGSVALWVMMGSFISIAAWRRHKRKSVLG